MFKLSSAQDAIRQAEEKGKYDPKSRFGRDEKYILLDPLFWQALGKARGWDEADHTGGEAQFSGAWELQEERARNKWKLFAAKWFETRLSNGDEQKFWESLP